MKSSERTHPYHMVEPSKWPVLSTFGALTAAIGGVWSMHGGSVFGLFFGIGIIIYSAYCWWRDVVHESRNGIDYTNTVRRGLRIGVVLFIVSEVMFFFAFFWAFADATVPIISRTAHVTWPPEGVVPLDPFGLPLINTLILLASGGTVTYAHHMLKLNNHARCADGLFLTVILGIIFTFTQGIEYGHATFGFSDGIYSSTFYLATGFHGLHVIVGTIFLGVCYWRCKLGHFSAMHHIGFEAAAWYWHFVDVVWLFLYGCIYWWGSLSYFVPS